MEKHAAIVIAMLIGSFLSACDEPLPVREDLSQQVVTRLSSGFIVQDGQMFLRFYLTVKNRLDETLEGVTRIGGTVQAVWIPGPNAPANFNNVRTFRISADHIFKGASLYNGQTGRLRLAPGDSIVFFVNWNLKTDDSTYLPSLMSSKIDYQCSVVQLDGNSGWRKISPRQKFMFSASIRLFDQLSVLYAQPVTMQQCIVGPYLRSSAECVNVNLTDPCSIIGQ